MSHSELRKESPKSVRRRDNMTPQTYTLDLLSTILNKHSNGITLEKLVQELMEDSADSPYPLYLGPEWHLREYLQELQSKGKVELVSFKDSLFIKPILDSLAEVRCDASPD